jgi:fluoride exporter
MRNIIIVGVGGCAGSICRYLVSGWVQSLSGSALFPYGTLSVNVLGCLLIGLLGGWADNAELLGPSTRLFLLIGVLGGFTTFSSFGYETMALMRDRQLLAASANVGLHVVVGFAAVALGYGLSNLRG